MIANRLTTADNDHMSEVTRILAEIDSGDPRAAERLLPLVYDELRKLAAARLAREKPGQTLEATALVHEAYLRLVGSSNSRSAPDGWNSRGHFFAAAAEAMRRILVEQARRKRKRERLGPLEREGLADLAAPQGLEAETLLAIHEILENLSVEEPLAARVVTLHFFAGLTLEETANALAISRATVYREWAYARARLRSGLSAKPGE